MTISSTNGPKTCWLTLAMMETFLILEGAKRCTGKEPKTYHLVLPNLSMGNMCTVFLEECYLDKKDPLLFAQAERYLKFNAYVYIH